MTRTNPRNSQDRRREEDRWKLDKHIPIAIILAIISQGLFGVWWVAGLQHSIQDHEKRLATVESTKISERMAVVESQITASRELQVEMNKKLDLILIVGKQK